MLHRDFVDARIYKYIKTKMFTSILAEVVNTDKYESENTIDAIPVIADLWEEDGSAVTFPTVYNIPVVTYSGGGAVVTVPIQVGDIVSLQVQMRNIDNWKQGSEEDIVVPTDSRMFNFTDSIAFPCVYNKRTTVNPNPDDLELRYNDSVVRLKKDGNVTISTKGNVVVEEAVNINITNSGQTNITTSGSANVKASSVNVDASVTNLGVGGNKIARIGDSVQVNVTSGSSSGTWSGTITSGGTNTSI